MLFTLGISDRDGPLVAAIDLRGGPSQLDILINIPNELISTHPPPPVLASSRKLLREKKQRGV